MTEIRTNRLILRPFRESDYDDLYEFLSQLRDDEFEGCPGITYENGGFLPSHWAMGAPIWKETFVYAILESDVRKASEG